MQAAVKNDPNLGDDGASVFDGFVFHMLRHTAASLMALAGMDPAVAAERLEHSDGGALFHKTYRHLYEGEKREQARRLEALVLAELDEEGTAASEGSDSRLTDSDSVSGRTWDRTRDLSRVKRALSR